jgi:hypothetical protein
MTWTAENRTSPLIGTPQAPRHTGATPDSHFESAFHHNDQCDCSPGSHNWANESKAYLAHAVTREPKALRLHIERILLHAETGDPAILGALCDLFLILGEKGLPLRRRMLALARPLLSTIHYQTLKRQLNKGECNTSYLQTLCSGAVLSECTTGTTQLIRKQARTNEVEEDPLETASELLEQGQTALAQKTLEQALLASPDRLELHFALLDIYRHTRDSAQVKCFWQRLQGRNNPAATEWRRLLQQLDEEATTP